MKTALNKIYHHRYYPVLLLGVHLAIFGLAVFSIDYFSRDEIKNLLKKWVPWNLKLNFLLIIAGIGVCYQGLLNIVKQLWNKKGIFLLALVIFAFCTASFVAPRTHRIFYDEDIYANIGQNIALTGETGFCNYGTFEYDEYHPHWTTYNKEPSGWPYLISLVFKLLGTNELYAFVLNNLIFSASVLVAFFIAWYLLADYFAAFLSGLAFALIPHNLIWANTASAEPSAAFFSGLTVLLLVVFFRTGKDRHLFVLAVTIPFACQIRPESMLILFFSITAFAVFSPKTLANRKVWTYAVLITVMLIPLFLHFYAVAGHSWGAEGPKFSLSFLENNLRINGLYYLDNKAFPAIFTALAVIGLFSAGCVLKWRLMLLFWFLLFWGIFLFFYAGSYHYGADVRFALLSFMPLALLAGMGGSFIRDKIMAVGQKSGQAATINPHTAICLIILVMFFAFVEFLPLIRRVGQEAWGARYDHNIAEKFAEKIPRRSIILTHNPSMFLLRGQNAIQTYAGLENPDIIEYLMEKYQGQVYFHYNYWCNTESAYNQRLCQGIKKKYRLEKIAGASEQNYEYVLYKMSLKE